MYICISVYLVLVHVHVSVCAVAVCTFLWLCGSCAYASACVIRAVRVQYALCKHPYLCDDCVCYFCFQKRTSSPSGHVHVCAS